MEKENLKKGKEKMDKNTLSHYGWIVIAIIILSIFIAIAIPISDYVTNSIANMFDSENNVESDVKDPPPGGGVEVITSIPITIGDSYPNSFDYIIGKGDFDYVKIYKNEELVATIRKPNVSSGKNVYSFAGGANPFVYGDIIKVECYQDLNTCVGSGLGVYNYQESSDNLPGFIELSAYSGTYTCGDIEGRFEIITNRSGGTISVATSYSAVAIPHVDGTTVLFDIVGEGTATITVTSAATENYSAATAIYSVVVNHVMENDKCIHCGYGSGSGSDGSCTHSNGLDRSSGSLNETHHLVTEMCIECCEIVDQYEERHYRWNGNDFCECGYSWLKDPIDGNTCSHTAIVSNASQIIESGAYNQTHHVVTNVCEDCGEILDEFEEEHYIYNDITDTCKCGYIFVSD